MNILHIIPHFAFANTYHGTYKDVMSRVRWFESNVADYQQIRIEPGADIATLRPRLPVVSPDAVLVEYTRFPHLLEEIRRRYPDARLATRAINIEPLQLLDNDGWWSRRGPVWMLYAMIRLLCNDARSRALSDVVLPISDWEACVYWRRLPGRSRIEWLPYYCPDHLVPSYLPPRGVRRTIACLPTSQKNRKSWDLVMRFFCFATAMKAAGADYDFVVTGDLDAWGVPDCPAVQTAGMVKDLASFLATVRAVCVLSPLGYGFKTTMGDSLAAGADIIAHPTLLRRCPGDIRSAALPLDTARMDTALVQSWLSRETDSNGPAVHAAARSRNHAILADWVRGGKRTTTA